MSTTASIAAVAVIDDLFAADFDLGARACRIARSQGHNLRTLSTEDPAEALLIVAQSLGDLPSGGATSAIYDRAHDTRAAIIRGAI